MSAAAQQPVSRTGRWRVAYRGRGHRLATPQTAQP